MAERVIPPHPEPRTEMAISPETEAELWALCEALDRIASLLSEGFVTTVSGAERPYLSVAFSRAARVHKLFDLLGDVFGIKGTARKHLPALLDQIAADREMVEEAAKGLAEFIAAVEKEVNEKGGGGYVLARLTDARALLAKLRTASQHPLLTPLPEDEASALRDFGPDPDTLRPGENDSLDTHQDKPFGAGGQESGR